MGCRSHALAQGGDDHGTNGVVVTRTVFAIKVAEGHAFSACRIHEVVFSTHEHATSIADPSNAVSCTMSLRASISARNTTS